MDQRIIDLIAPHTGAIDHTEEVTTGYGVSTTLRVDAVEGRFFLKATPNEPGGNLDAARREAAVGPFVAGVSPRVRFTVEDSTWFVVAFDLLDARPSDFTSGSADLPVVIDTVNRMSTGTSLPPDLVLEWEETRWDRFTTEDEKPLLKGVSLIHADIHERNLLISDGHGWLVDWEWPTAGAEVIVPGCLAVQLVASGHSPEAAEKWVSETVSWQNASLEARAVFARVDARMHRWLAKVRGEKWLEAMAEAAEAWAAHVDT
ncbi:protein kinase [Nocardiopsis protaetiae]|uniref:protein kinase n=1 Tax=Nocardiopsis protaetiae TaxID=3382270 RepID=UPI00387B619E